MSRASCAGGRTGTRRPGEAPVYEHGLKRAEIDPGKSATRTTLHTTATSIDTTRDIGERFGELWRAGLDRLGPTGDSELDICPGSSLLAEELAGK